MTTPEPVQIHADHDTARHLGNWTTARSFQLRARHARLEIDLRSPPGRQALSDDHDQHHAGTNTPQASRNSIAAKLSCIG